MSNQDEQSQEYKYNPTCIITGTRTNLHMYPARNDKKELVGWIFLHEDIKMDKQLKITFE